MSVWVHVENFRGGVSLTKPGVGEKKNRSHTKTWGSGRSKNEKGVE